MNDYAIVVLSGYPDIWMQFRKSADLFERSTEVFPIFSGELRKMAEKESGIYGIFGPEPFSFPRNANLGIKAAGTRDVFLINDDVQFLHLDSVATLARIAHAHPEVGILSPQFEGQVGNALQEKRSANVTVQPGRVIYSERRICFVGVYLKRSVIDRVGLMDECFDGYGRDDDAYCLRVQRACFKLAVTPEVVMRHGFGADQHSASFKRAGRYPANGIDPHMTDVWNEWLKGQK